jgi:hypothetical protein
MKCRASVRVVFGPKAPAVGFDNRPTNGKSHAEPFALGSIERLENPSELVTRQTGAMISDRNLNRAGAVCLRPHFDVAFRCNRFLHRVKGVNQQIEDNLLQLHSVTAHTRQAILAFNLDANVA